MHTAGVGKGTESEEEEIRALAPSLDPAWHGDRCLLGHIPAVTPGSSPPAVPPSGTVAPRCCHVSLQPASKNSASSTNRDSTLGTTCRALTKAVAQAHHAPCRRFHHVQWKRLLTSTSTPWVATCWPGRQRPLVWVALDVAGVAMRSEKDVLPAPHPGSRLPVPQPAPAGSARGERSSERDPARHSYLPKLRSEFAQLSVLSGRASRRQKVGLQGRPGTGEMTGEKRTETLNADHDGTRHSVTAVSSVPLHRSVGTWCHLTSPTLAA